MNPAAAQKATATTGEAHWGARNKTTPKQTTKRNVRRTRRPEWIEPSCCACETQAYRIGVVVDLIRHITDRRAEEDIDDGGWRLTAPGF